jgi:peptide/nickel transport system substrate-binding protein
MIKKKWLMLLLALMIALVTALAGCSNNKSSDSNTGGNSGGNTGGTATTGTSQNDASSSGGSGGGDAKRGGTLTIATIGEPPTLDVHVATAYQVQQVGWHIFEGLFTLDDNYNATPMLAKDYSYDESTTRIRSGCAKK